MPEVIRGVALRIMVLAEGGNEPTAPRIHRTAPTTRKSSLDEERDRVVL
ncbi:hypothetical protein ACLMAJ_19195 [Nocardia sp. KC 131]